MVKAFRTSKTQYMWWLGSCADVLVDVSVYGRNRLHKHTAILSACIIGRSSLKRREHTNQVSRIIAYNYRPQNLREFLACASL